MNNVKYNWNVEELRFKSCLLILNPQPRFINNNSFSKIYVCFYLSWGKHFTQHFMKKGVFLASTLIFNV